ncbi:hypothetical protein [uncultured Amaricoccus sp.]|uniref:hypothetical protein n=1 Tax=uncultured Amaricoccus sp. TaxID=339341 RepID=UPI0026236B18|nr:hypothetical protein [uncultured Amaricoccus sp.]
MIGLFLAGIPRGGDAAGFRSHGRPAGSVRRNNQFGLARRLAADFALLKKGALRRAGADGEDVENLGAPRIINTDDARSEPRNYHAAGVKRRGW